MLRTLGCALGLTVAAVEDASLLVQASVQSHAQSAVASTERTGIAGRMKALSHALTGQLPAASNEVLPFDCGKHPELCKAPFNCDTYTVQDAAQTVNGLAPVGKANLRNWCRYPSHGKYVDTCVLKKDPVQAAWLQYNWSLQQQVGADDMDASYCFIEGHCTNAAVTNKTGLEDTGKMCDDRFGHNDWTTLGSIPTWGKIADIYGSIPKDYSEGIHDPRLGRLFTRVSCAMGTYHCDVMYCKETYCQMPQYVRKFGHLLPKAPGHLLQFITYQD